MTTALKDLRKELVRRGLDGFVVPRSDEHQGEYVPPSAERLRWLTGFSGSAGVAVVLADRAALFVDGRYSLQAKTEVDAKSWTLLHLVDQPPPQWLGETLGTGQKLGYDPWLHTPNGVESLRQACEKAGAGLVPCPDNPLDAVWQDRPPPPLAPLEPHALAYAGKPSTQKRAELGNELKTAGCDAVVLSAPESIAWLLNLRGGDVPYSPLPLSFALAWQDGGVDLFVDHRKMTAEAADHLGRDVRVGQPDRFGPALDALSGKRIRLDPATAPAWALDRLTAAKAAVDRGADPCGLPKACKNDVELDGARRAHRRDGVALVRFLAWLAAHAGSGRIGEIAAADRLDRFRGDGELYRGPSFPTISGAGPNGAIVHYRANPASDRKLRPGQLYLVDSGGQYLDGTTDVTRTLAIGDGDFTRERRHFTLVLKGHIAIAALRFPEGTTGSQMDILARRALWAEDLDYDHGTGHGVGSYLGVHEGPQRISKLPSAQALKPGMIVSDEPGYYLAGAYGIRIENLVAVRKTAAGRMLDFEVLTLAPIDLALVERDLLERDELAWLNAYHARVRQELTPFLDPAEAAWLAQATREI
ncbi:MAG TPA: aminopeptidase P family protein [Rhodospirillaceae bacterium]|nr:aminopeptidase P family protein [Rhodospirillaceae bacterium]